MTKKIFIVLSIIILNGCYYPTQQHYETSTWLGALGAGTGAILDAGNPWRGAMLGELAGLITGYGLAEIYHQDHATYYDTYYGSSCRYYRYVYPPRYECTYCCPPPHCSSNKGFHHYRCCY